MAAAPSFSSQALVSSLGAAETMSRALGAENYPFVVVSHPISSATKDELKIQAGNALQEGITFLLNSDRSNEKVAHASQSNS